jgi:ribosomal protein L14
MLFKEALIGLTDNTGAKLVKVIGTYKFNLIFSRIGSLFISSLNKVLPRRKLRKGSLFRAYTVRVRFPTYRDSGFYIFCSTNKAVLFKTAENLPVANRVKGYVLIEIFFNNKVPFPNVTIYSV